jgi:hypothetical protein
MGQFFSYNNPSTQDNDYYIAKPIISEYECSSATESKIIQHSNFNEIQNNTYSKVVTSNIIVHNYDINSNTTIVDHKQIIKHNPLNIGPVSGKKGDEIYSKDKPWHPGSERAYGYYRCLCGSWWTSAYSWADKSQKCKKCGTDIIPYKQEPLKSRDDNNDEDRQRKPHIQSLCEKCRELGRLCTITMELSKKFNGDVIIKGLPIDITELKLKEEYRKFGPILRLYLPPLKLEYSSRVAYITYQNPAVAIRKFNGD